MEVDRCIFFQRSRHVSTVRCCGGPTTSPFRGMIGSVDADRWEQLVEQSVGGPISRGSMFGSQGLRIGSKFFALWWHDRLVVKPSPQRLRELVAAGSAEPFEPMPGRPMNGWVVVGYDADWTPLVEEARAFVESQQK